MRTAIVIGATGLVGRNLVQSLLASDQFENVLTFVRNNTGIQHPKLIEHRIQFDKPGRWRELVRGDILFSCLGTTMKAAGGEEAQHKVDHGYQLTFATIAAKHDIPGYVLVSSAGANPLSRNFYLRMKGDLEEKVLDLHFKHIAIVRPGLLKGERDEARTGEKVGETVLKIFNSVGILKKYRPIPAETVARAMIQAGLRDETERIYEPDELFTLGEHK